MEGKEGGRERDTKGAPYLGTGDQCTGDTGMASPAMPRTYMCPS